MSAERKRRMVSYTVISQQGQSLIVKQGRFGRKRAAKEWLRGRKLFGSLIRCVSVFLWQIFFA